MEHEVFDSKQFQEKIKKIFKHQKLLSEALKKNETPAHFLDIRQEELEFLYSKAKDLIEKKEYEKAADSFFFLVILDSNRVEFWLGMGLSLQKLSHFEEAIDAYEMAAIITPTDPYPYLFLSKCFFSLHEHKNALEAIEMAQSLLEEEPEKYQAIKKEVQEVTEKIHKII